MRSPGGTRPARIGDVLQERIAALGWGRRLREEEVVTGWDDAVGPQIAAHARPSHVVNRRLTVVTESPVWTQQLALLKPELLRRIAARFGPDAVTDLFFVTGRIDPVPAPRATAGRERRPADLPAEVQDELDGIGDAGVRDSVRRLIVAALGAGDPAA
jgi:predicted nucleic acid-binding Zn ribbon protein